MNNAVVAISSLLVALLVSYCLAEDPSHPSHGDHMSSYQQNPAGSLSLEDEDIDKRGWNQLQSSGWGKRGWNQLQSSGWGKRGWQDLHSNGWGKRGWNQLRGSGWGKRGWDNLHNSGWGKRAWSQLQGGWGKRDLDAVMEEDNSADYSPEDEEKRAWQTLKGSWGKRDPAWHNLKGLWGKRASISEFSSPYAYSRGMSGGFFQPDDSLLRLE